MSQTPTTIEPWLREILRCPQCKGELVDAIDPSGAAELHCHAGVPVLLVDLARRLG